MAAIDPRTEEDPTGLDTEILQEKIATYVRIARQLERLVDAAHNAHQQAATATGPERRQRIDVFHRLREQAEEHLWYLVVQREAIGLYRNEGLERHYPIPPRIRE
jgi:hypothetical protein